jgi:hypothetical protein
MVNQNQYQKLQKLYKGVFKGLPGRGAAQQEIMKRYNYFTDKKDVGLTQLGTILKLQDTDENKRQIIDNFVAGNTVMEVENVIPEQIDTREYTIDDDVDDEGDEEKLFKILTEIPNYKDFGDSVVSTFIYNQTTENIKKYIKTLTVKDINRIFRQLRKIEDDLEKEEDGDYYETKEFKDAISIDLPETDLIETSGEKQVDLVPTPIEPTESKVIVSDNSIKLKPTNLGENNIDYEIKIGDKTQRREPEEVYGLDISNIPDAITAKAPTKSVKITTRTKGKTIKEFRTGKSATGEVRPSVKIANVQTGPNTEQQLDVLDDMEKPVGNKYIKSATRQLPKSNITTKPTRQKGRAATGNIRPPITINKIDDTVYVDDYVLPEPTQQVKKEPVKKTATKKAPVKKAPVKKTAVKKTATKKAPVKKTATKKTPVMKAGKKMSWQEAVKFYYSKYNPDCYYPKKGTKHHDEVIKLMGK